MRLRIVLLFVLVVSLCLTGTDLMQFSTSGRALGSVTPQVPSNGVSLAQTAAQIPDRISAQNQSSNVTISIVTGVGVPEGATVQLQLVEVSNVGGVLYQVLTSRQKTVSLSGGGVSTPVTFTLRTTENNPNGGTITSKADITAVSNCQAIAPQSSNTFNLIVNPPTVASICNPSPLFLSWCSDYDWIICGCVGVIDKSPIVIDVQGNGYNMTNARNGVNFDLNGDGVPDRLSWTAAGSDDAFLVLDRNANRTIDDGSELFGNFTPQAPSDNRNGFLALRELDKPEAGGNGDGELDSRDSLFSRLQLWQDANHNGVSEPDELYSLASAGIEALYLDYQISKHTDENGNQYRYRAKLGASKHSPVGKWYWDVLLTLGQ